MTDEELNIKMDEFDKGKAPYVLQFYEFVGMTKRECEERIRGLMVKTITSYTAYKREIKSFVEVFND